MKPITIKRNYYPSTKDLLKKIRPYTHDVSDYSIVMMLKKDSPFRSFYWEIRWNYNNEKHKLEVITNPSWIADKVISEIIEALTLVGKDIHYEYDYYY